MFSLQFEATLKSGIGKRLTLLQHLISLAVVESVKSLKDGYENVDLRLKWPNDIYAGSQYKIGGVVVLTSCIGNVAQVKSAQNIPS
jgi:biotin--protein ligase